MKKARACFTLWPFSWECIFYRNNLRRIVAALLLKSPQRYGLFQARIPNIAQPTILHTMKATAVTSIPIYCAIVCPVIHSTVFVTKMAAAIAKIPIAIPAPQEPAHTGSIPVAASLVKQVAAFSNLPVPLIDTVE